MIGGGNCFRRALLEMALDRGAAGDPLLMGFNVHGGRLAGHAWLPADDTGERRGVGSPVPPAYQFTVRL
jgi:hypothetical protein